MEFREILEKLVQAQRDYDATTLDKLFSEDYIEISPVGEVDKRAKVLSFYHKSNKKLGAKIPNIEITDLQVNLHDNYAFVIVKETFSLPSSKMNFSMRASFILKRNNSKWLFSTAHYTRIRP